MKIRFAIALFLAAGGGALLADEGMWRLDQLPLDTIAEQYGVRVSQSDLERLQSAPVRILSGGGGGTGTFTSANGLVLTNHHVALDCIRTLTLAEQEQGSAENLVEQGFTARSRAEELSCKRFRVQVERSATDVTDKLDTAVTPGMNAEHVQQARQLVRSDLERACQAERGENFSCNVVDFNSGARSLLVVWEQYADVRLVYAPEKQLGYFGGDEMNFRFPRFVSDISILRIYTGRDGVHREYDSMNVPVRPDHYLRVTLDGLSEGDFTLVAGFPANTNRYRMSFSADYNARKGIPDQIVDIERQLELLQPYAAMRPEYEVVLQSQIFGLSNTLKYQRDVLAALRATGVVDDRRRREADFMAFLEERPDLESEYGGVLDAQGAVYAEDVEANADLDSALGWLQRASVLGYATSLYQFAVERAKPSDRDREPQFQERNWPFVRQALLSDDPIILELDEDLLTVGFEKALSLGGDQRIAAVDRLITRVQTGAAEPSARDFARAVLRNSGVPSVENRRSLVDASVSDLESSNDPALSFARDLEPSLADQRQRIRVLNEKLFINRAKFARGLAAWQADAIYPDANFTLRATFGRVAGYVDGRGIEIPAATRFAGLFALAEDRGNAGNYALPPRLVEWRRTIDDEDFASRLADLPVDFVSTNDITGGNSGSAILNRNLEIVGLIFDGNEEAMASDWTYSETAGRAISTDIRFALTLAREVHAAGWVVDELLDPGRVMPNEE